MARFVRLAALFLLPVLLSGCGENSAKGPLGDSGSKVTEITDYDGQQLSNTNYIPENSLHGTQNVNIETWQLTVEGMVDNPRKFSYDELLKRQRITRVVWVHCVEGWSARIFGEGFSLSKLFDEVGVDDNATHAQFYGVDGFSTFLTLDYIRTNDIIAATHANGNPLSAALGFPLFVVSESKYGYKWCKWVNRIVLSNGEDGVGSYENLGYSRTGDVGDHYYDPDSTHLKP